MVHYTSVNLVPSFLPACMYLNELEFGYLRTHRSSILVLHVLVPMDIPCMISSLGKILGEPDTQEEQAQTNSLEDTMQGDFSMLA